MKKANETNVQVWVFGLLLCVLLVTAVIWLALESVHGRDDPADITLKMYLVGGAIVLLFMFSVFGWWYETNRIRNFDKKIQAELDVRPISKMELFAKYINRDLFYGPLEWTKGCLLHEHRFHGKYKGYEICILDPFPVPHFYGWDTKVYASAVHIKSNSFHFPKFLIRNKWIGKFFVKGDQKAQMRFAKPHILNFFNQCRKFAAQGNENEFIFHEISSERGNYKLILEHAFIVLELLSKAAPYSSISEIGKLEEQCKHDHKRTRLGLPCLLIAALTTPIFVYLLFFK